MLVPAKPLAITLVRIIYTISLTAPHGSSLDVPSSFIWFSFSKRTTSFQSNDAELPSSPCSAAAFGAVGCHVVGRSLVVYYWNVLNISRSVSVLFVTWSFDSVCCLPWRAQEQRDGASSQLDRPAWQMGRLLHRWMGNYSNHILMYGPHVQVRRQLRPPPTACWRAVRQHA